MFKPLFNRSICFPTITSTQHAIKRLAQQDAPEGIVAVADEQTEEGEKGLLLACPRIKNLFRFCSGLISNSAMYSFNSPQVLLSDRCSKTNKVDARLKWPNDILVNGRKICGILARLQASPTGYITHDRNRP